METLAFCFFNFIIQPRNIVTLKSTKWIKEHFCGSINKHVMFYFNRSCDIMVLEWVEQCVEHVSSFSVFTYFGVRFWVVTTINIVFATNLVFPTWIINCNTLMRPRLLRCLCLIIVSTYNYSHNNTVYISLSTYPRIYLTILKSTTTQCKVLCYDDVTIKYQNTLTPTLPPHRWHH